MDKPLVNNGLVEMNEFLLSPYKITLSVFIQEFTNLRSKLSQREIGQFCILIMKLIQEGFDLPYLKLLSQIKSELEIKNLSIALCVRDRIEKMKDEGVGSLLDLIAEMKNIAWINRGSFLGIFVRRLYLYFDKLSFTGVMELYDEFKKYVSKSVDIHVNDEQPIETSNCPKQMQNFINKQLSLLQINEKKALAPDFLSNLIKNYEDQNKNNQTVTFPNPADFFKRKNNLNEINFLKYMNAIRVNEFVTAKHALFAYFDGISNYGSRCWPALNLAMFYYHFKHFSLSIESLKECVSSAQDSNDERCLEYALIWIAKIILQKRDKSYSDEDILAILHHLQIKATNLELHNIASIASLHYEKLTGLHSKKRSASGYVQGNVLNADLVAVKNSLNDILMMTYSCKSAHFHQIGAVNLASLTSQALLHLHAVEPIGDEFVSHVNENTAIALRNMALHLWKNLGEYELAKDILIKLSQNYFAYHNNQIIPIWKSALAEIEFEYYLFRNEWLKALNAIETLKLFDLNEGKLRQAEYELRKGDKKKAMQIINEFVPEDCLDKDLLSYFRVRRLLLKSKIMNNISTIFEPLHLASEYQLKSLECLTLIELCFQLNKIGQLTQSLNLLKNQMIYILENLPQIDIARSYYLIALNLKDIYRRDDQLDSRREDDEDGSNLRKRQARLNSSKQEALERIIENNLNAIKILEKISEIELLKLCYKLQAEIYDELGDLKNRKMYIEMYIKIVAKSL